MMNRESSVQLARLLYRLRSAVQHGVICVVRVAALPCTCMCVYVYVYVYMYSGIQRFYKYVYVHILVKSLNTRIPGAPHRCFLVGRTALTRQKYRQTVQRP